MPKNSLRQDKEIQRVLKQKPFFSRHLTVKKKENNADQVRFAIVISKKVSKLAVRRNKLRRQLKEIITQFIPHIETNLDIVVLVKKSALELKFEELKQEVEQVFKKARVI